jgi:hypothetical protein
MTAPFQIIRSSKVGLDSDESYVVVRDWTSFLRVLGGEPTWELMTATASEDRGRIKVCSDQRHLIESALRLGGELKTDPKVEKDWRNREYVKVCVITRDSGQSDEVFNSENSGLFRRFFEIYDEHKGLGSRARDEMRELYELLSTDNGGGEVYLSDGIWLSNDGAVHDRGR